MVKKKFNSLNILKYIGDVPRQSPFLIAKHFDISPSHIRMIMVVLNDLGLVERETRGIYVLTEMGLKVLAGEIKRRR